MELSKRAATDFQKHYRLKENFIDAMARGGGATGMVKEVSDEITREYGQHPNGCWIHPRALCRDLSVAQFSQGGATVQTDVESDWIPLLRNTLTATRLGITTMTNLRGNVAIPRQTSTATVQALPETQAVTTSTPSLDQVMLSPKRVSCSTVFSRELQIQSVIDVENFIASDMRQALAIKWDKLMVSGSGSNSEPSGIMNTTGVGSVQFGGAATYAKVLDFETQLANANAIKSDSKLAFLTSPSVRAKLKNTPKIGTTFPVYIWENGDDMGGATQDGNVIGYRAAVSNQVSDTNTVIFGDWRSMIFATWGALDLTINPYSLDVNAQVRITINTFIDVAIRTPVSFVVSSDAGNQ